MTLAQAAHMDNGFELDKPCNRNCSLLRTARSSGGAQPGAGTVCRCISAIAQSR